MHSMLQDLRFALRRLIKDRWFTLAAIAALALGIGANSAVFTLVNAVLLQGMPFDRPDRIRKEIFALDPDLSVANVRLMPILPAPL